MNWPTKQILGASLLCTLFLTTGCASTLLRDITKANGGRMDITYPSVRYAADSFKHPSKLTPLILIDLPFSVVLDTVMLPFDTANTKRSNKGKPETD